MNATVRVLLAGAICAWAGLVPTNAVATGQPSAQGYWVGRLTESSQDLPVRVWFGQQPAGTWSGNFSADSQAVMDYPFDSVRVKGSRIGFVLGGGALVFSGTLGAQTMVGTFSGAQGTGRLSLVRSAAPKFPYAAQKLVFYNGGTPLAGSLYTPNTAGHHPAVVLLHGSGCQTRWGTLRFIADQLARRGVAGFIYDKRGCGESGGSWQTVGYPVLADDAIAAIEVLRHRKDIDPARVGIWGHSEGGNIAPLIATRSSHVAFIVAADAPAMVVHDQDIYRFRNELRDAGGTAQGNAAALALYEQFDDVARSGQGYASLRASMQRSKQQPWFPLLGIPPRKSWVWAWYPRVANYDSRQYWQNVKVPVLLVYGERDRLMPVDTSIATIESILRARGDTNAAAIILPGAPHTLDIEPIPKGTFFWWHVVAGYPNLVIDWIKQF